MKLICLFIYCLLIFCVINHGQSFEETRFEEEINNSSLNENESIIEKLTSTTDSEILIEQVTEQSYPPIYVLNLDRSIQRWEKMETELNSQNINAIRLSGVDGRKLTKKELSTVSTSLSTYLQPKGVIGCYLSHKKFWQLIVDESLPSAIVFEDDVKLSDNFIEKLTTNLKEFGKFLKLNTIKTIIKFKHTNVSTIFLDMLLLHFRNITLNNLSCIKSIFMFASSFFI